MSKQESATECALILALQRKCETQAQQLEIVQQHCSKFSICANCDEFIPELVVSGEFQHPIEERAYNYSCFFCYDQFAFTSNDLRICYCKKCSTHCLQYQCPHRKVCKEHLTETYPCFDCA